MKPTIWKNDKYEIKYEVMEEDENNNWQHVILIWDNIAESMCAIERFVKNDEENDFRKEVELGVDNIIANVKELEDYRDEIECKLKERLIR